MADLVRRTWAQMRDEGLKRVGRQGDSATESRMEHALAAAYFDLSLYHHYELDQREAIDIAFPNLKISLPADCYIVMFANLLDNAGAFIKGLILNRSNFQFATRRNAAGQPETYTRFGNELFVERPVDADYKIDLFYYRHAPAPDFAGSVNSPLSWLWDEHLIEAAVAKFHGAFWRWDLSGANLQLLERFISTQPQPPVAARPLFDHPEQRTTGRPHGGAQG